jgi:hypothetical protein
MVAVPAVAVVGGGGLLWRLGYFEETPQGAADVDFSARLPTTLLECEPGILADETKALIWKLAQSMGQRWGMSSLTRSDLSTVLDLKTGQRPSYLAEYESAASLLREVKVNGWSEVVSLMLATPLVSDAAWYSPTQHMRLYVFEELLNLHLIRGGIERFGLSNARGFIGGTFRYRKASAPWVTSP